MGKGVTSEVFIADINEAVGRQTVDELQRRYGKDSCRFMVVDITQASKFQEAFQAAVIECGHIDLMVNNAGRFHEFDWEPVIDLNFICVVRGCELAIQHMSKKNGGRGGRIINTCSDLGTKVFCDLPVYSATKHAVRAFTSNKAEQANLELTGVQLACICPPATDTNMLRTISDSVAPHPDRLREIIATEGTCTPTCVSEGFLKLLRMRKMNGALLMVKKTNSYFIKMEAVNLGEDCTPSQ
ncbi:15-hydroxyprostaglandin dehydrogenase [Elysia marginata]|uniref:15-hydroxyprostaglandin dehydrogenase [NAD(+)] n=1 Tax=Elysia marginata TaxID=1093978 RepID=A0AAV4EPQ1_9GAST|nr:15-hydroxyprostaglandin dehydrogenase [Elysia marginata]